MRDHTLLEQANDFRVNADWVKLPLFDRSKWQRVQFGDVVQNVNESVRDLAEAGIDRFIAMEHLESGSLHIHTWGDVVDGTTFSRRCRPDQVLFGKRRAYQRKVAVAEFDAVVSGDIYVFTPKDERLLPELLPFLCMSERFFNFAVETSAGSLSPRTNWDHLAPFEFELPSMADQHRLAHILWSTDETLQKMQSVNQALMTYEVAFVHSELSRFGDLNGILQSRTEIDANGWVVASGETLLKKAILLALKDGNHGEQYPRSNEFSKIGVPYIAASHISDDGEIDFESCPKLSAQVKNRLRIPAARAGDVLLTHNATVGRVAVIPDEIEELVASTTTTYYRTNPIFLSNAYLAAYLRTWFFQRQLQRVMKQSTRDQVPITAQKKLLFIVPPREFQSKFVESTKIMREIAVTVKASIANGNALMSSFLNSI